MPAKAVKKNSRCDYERFENELSEGEIVKVAVLCWAALVPQKSSPKTIENCRPGGPSLPIEFARVSSGKRLTLFICSDSNRTKVPWSELKARNLEDAIDQMSRRQGIPKQNIESVDLISGKIRSRLPKLLTDHMAKWGKRKGFSGVIWPDLQEHFSRIDVNVLDLKRAIDSSKKFSTTERGNAQRYTRQAPRQTNMKIRRAIDRELRRTSRKDD